MSARSRELAAAETPDVDPDLRREFDLGLLQNEYQRASLIAGLFGVLALFLALRWLLEGGTAPGPSGSETRLGVALLISASLAGFELAYGRYVLGRMRAGRTMPTAVWYVATTLEFAALVAAFWFRQGPMEVEPVLAGLPGQVAMLSIMVMVSVFRLHFVITTFTGLLAGATYLMIVVLAGQHTGSSGAPEEVYWVAGFLVGGGVIAGIIARRIGRQTLRLAQSNRHRRELTSQMSQIAEEEQRRIGRDLHDGLGSHLAGVSMLCRGLVRRLEKKEPIRRDEMEDVAKMVEEAVAQARLLSRGLNPVKLQAGGLSMALSELAASIEMVSAVSCQCRLDGNLDAVDQKSAEQLYLIAAEASTNAARHAKADHIWIDVTVGITSLEMTVRDDGAGIPAGSHTDGMGIRSMRYRASLLGASFSLTERPAGGTLVRIEMGAMSTLNRGV